MTTNSHCCAGFQSTFNVHQNLGMVKKLTSTFQTMVDDNREVIQRQLFHYTILVAFVRNCNNPTSMEKKKFCPFTCLWIESTVFIIVKQVFFQMILR